MKIDCISDLHGFYPKLEGGDLLIVAGDLTARDMSHERVQFLKWFADQDYRKKIWIAGNHDNSLIGLKFDRIRPVSAEYLCDSGTEFEGLKIWGSPWTKTFSGMNPKCKAFTCDNDEELAEKWALIPDDIDILITHSPPYGIFDEIRKIKFSGRSSEKENVGSQSLRNLILDGNRFKNLKLHVFGHIHEYGGKTFETSLTKFVNSSIVDENYEHVNEPIRIEI